MVGPGGEEVAWKVVVLSALFRGEAIVRVLGEVDGCWLLGGTVVRWGGPEAGAGAE